jgi:hypothetical protein
MNGYSAANYQLVDVWFRRGKDQNTQTILRMVTNPRSFTLNAFLLSAKINFFSLSKYLMWELLKNEEYTWSGPITNFISIQRNQTKDTKISWAYPFNWKALRGFLARHWSLVCVGQLCLLIRL